MSMMRIGPVKTAVDVIGDDTFKNCSLEDPVELPLVAVEVVGRHRVGLARRLRLLVCASSFGLLAASARGVSD